MAIGSCCVVVRWRETRQAGAAGSCSCLKRTRLSWTPVSEPQSLPRSRFKEGATSWCHNILGPRWQRKKGQRCALRKQGFSSDLEPYVFAGRRGESEFSTPPLVPAIQAGEEAVWKGRGNSLHALNFFFFLPAPTQIAFQLLVRQPSSLSG